MRFQHAALIYNPASGRRRREREKKIEGARRLLAQWVGEIEVAATAGENDATRLTVEALAAGCDLIAACGGDGTFNEVVRGMVGSSATLLTLPAGTANVLAEETGLPGTPEKAAALVPRLAPYQVPLGVVRYQQPNPGVRYFLLMCGVGVDASIVYHLNHRLKTYLGQGAYWLGSLEQLQRPFESFQLRVGEQLHECTFAVMSKSRLYGGGLVLTPHAHLLSHQFELVIFPSDSPFRYVGYMAQIATRTLGRFSDVTFHHTDRVELTPVGQSPIYAEVDGELAGQIPAVVEMASESVTLLLPPEYTERRPAAAKREERLLRLSNQ